jgi:hypothetical protein
VNGFLARCGGLPPTAILVTCGGWDQNRYLSALERRLELLGATVLGGMTLKRRKIESGEAWASLDGFLTRCFPPDAA